MLGAFGAVDPERFQPRPPSTIVRKSLGFRPEHRVIGIVARIQRRRRFDLLLEAMSRLAQRDENARLLVIGRGTHSEAVAKIPAAKLGISDRVVFAGYRGAGCRLPGTGGRGPGVGPVESELARCDPIALALARVFGVPEQTVVARAGDG